MPAGPEPASGLGAKAPGNGLETRLEVVRQAVRAVGRRRLADDQRLQVGPASRGDAVPVLADEAFGLLALALFGTRAWAVALFCMLYGMSNGVLTIIRGTLPRVLFGARHYGAITGAMAAPSLLSKAAGPLVTAAILSGSSGTVVLPLVLFACALASLLLYLSAIKPAPARGVAGMAGT